MKKFFILILIIIFIVSCTKKAPHLPITSKNLYIIKRQQYNIKTIFWTGKINIRESGEDTEANILVIAKRDPLKIRIEISKWFSGPILYIVINRNKVNITSIKEKKVYIGDLQHINEVTSIKIFPPNINQNQIWTILRGIPSLYYIKNAKLKILNKKSTDIFFNYTRITYKNYQTTNGIIFAKDITIFYYPNNILWKLKIRNIRFNITIPDSEFQIKVPPNFKIVKYQSPNP